jgi:hypothetical protein
MALDWDGIFDKKKKDEGQGKSKPDLSSEAAMQTIFSKWQENDLAQKAVETSLVSMMFVSLVQAAKETSPEFLPALQKSMAAAYKGLLESEFYEKGDEKLEKLKETAAGFARSHPEFPDKIVNDFIGRMNKLQEGKLEKRAETALFIDGLAAKEDITIADMLDLAEHLNECLAFSGVVDVISQEGETDEKLKAVMSAHRSTFDQKHRFPATTLSKNNPIESSHMIIGSRYEDDSIVDVPNMFPATTEVSPMVDVSDKTLESFLDQWSKEIDN